jgi:hypothetical protein
LQPLAKITRARPADFLFERRRGDIPMPLNSRRHLRLLGFDDAAWSGILMETQSGYIKRP